MAQRYDKFTFQKLKITHGKSLTIPLKNNSTTKSQCLTYPKAPITVFVFEKRAEKTGD